MAPPHMLGGGDLPQANTLALVVDMVRRIASRDPRALRSFEHPRHRLFYQAACRILGLLEGRSLSPLGAEIAELEGNRLVLALRTAFERSRVGKAWLEWQGATSIEQLQPESAERFLGERSAVSPAVQHRRASTLSQWVRALQHPTDLSALRGPEQLSLFRRKEWRRWPSPKRFPHNEAGHRVRDVLSADLLASAAPLIVTGYSSLDELIQFLSRRPQPSSARLLLGTEPFPNSGSGGYPPREALSARIRDYWLARSVSILLSGAILAVREAVRAGHIEVRTAPANRPIHAKVYASDSSVVLGSSNFTPRGLGFQSEANARFERSEEPRFAEARDLAEGLWSLGEDFTAGFIALLDELLQRVTWREALARACSAVLEADWAKQYIPPELLSELGRPLWPHQVQGIGQAMWILENIGAVLIADAAGSGKTRMGAWLIRAAFDRQYRHGFSLRPSPLVVTPPAVVATWKEALWEAGLTLDPQSHGPLSSERAGGHDLLMRTVSNTELLAVDEAHNFLNASARTLRLVSHYAENAILFTATPINRSAADLLALVDLLGADNLSDESRATLNRLRRHQAGASAGQDLAPIREEIRRFSVRRTRSQLNAIADARPDDYVLPSGRRARYPHHRAEYYDVLCRAEDVKLAREISSLADQLLGVTRMPDALERPAFWTGDELSYVNRMLASARALARYHVNECLRSSRAALYEHALGTDEALARFAPPDRRDKSSKDSTGDMRGSARRCAGRVPSWKLEEVAPSQVPEWLHDPGAHRAACERDADLYSRIASLTLELSDDRERAKLDHLAFLAGQTVAIAFDSHVITLQLFRDELDRRAIPVALFTGQGGAPAKRRAVNKLGLGGEGERLVALCSDAFSEGLNLQRASCVVHLDTPTVIRLAEQRAGRVDRMDSPHDTVHIWWPRDPDAFAPRRRDVLRERHEMVEDLIGANLQLPEDNQTVDVSELASASNVEEPAVAPGEAEELFDAFRGVRAFIETGGLVGPELYSKLRSSKARIQSCVSTVSSEVPWAFLVVGGLERRAPLWVFFESPEATPVYDLTIAAAALRGRLGSGVRDIEPSEHATNLQETFIERLRRCEELLLPPRRRRALKLLQDVLDDWIAMRTTPEPDVDAYAAIRDWLFVPAEARREPFVDPRGLSDAWLSLIRSRVKRVLREQRRRRRFWTLDDLRADLCAEPVPPQKLREALAAVPQLQPVEERIVVMIVGVPEAPIPAAEPATP